MFRVWIVGGGILVSGLMAKQNNRALLQNRAGIPRFPSIDIMFHFGEFSSRNFKQEHFKGKQMRHKGTREQE